MMRFVETPIFTEAIENLLDHDRYRSLQETLILRPGEGAVIPKSGGLRKIRWALAEMGKRGECGLFTIGMSRARRSTCFMRFIRFLRAPTIKTSEHVNLTDASGVSWVAGILTLNSWSGSP
jgi:hypothetical protein